MAIPAVHLNGRAMRATKGVTFHENLIILRNVTWDSLVRIGNSAKTVLVTGATLITLHLYIVSARARWCKTRTARRMPGGVNKLKRLFELDEVVYSTFVVLVPVEVVSEVLHIGLVADWAPFTMRSCILARGVAFSDSGPRKSALRVNRFWFQICLRHSDSLQSGCVNEGTSALLLIVLYLPHLSKSLTAKRKRLAVLNIFVYVALK